MQNLLKGGSVPIQRLIPIWSASHRMFYPSATRLASTQSSPSVDLPDRAKVVICGGGVAGTSIAYHLAKLGWNDVLLLEQGSLTCGTTWHSVGLVGLLKSNSTLSQISRWSAELYESLKEETDIDTGFRVTGAVMLAQTQDRLISYKRLQAREREIGSECEMVTPSEIEKLLPYVRTTDIVGGLYSPKDGRTDAPNTVMALAKGARLNGVSIIEGVQVSKIKSENGRVSAVETSHGTVKCEYFVNCGGQWARDIGLKSDPIVRVPLHSVKHQYMITKPIPGVEPRNDPYIRDYDLGNYIIDWGGGFLVGMFAKKGQPIFFDGIPEKSEFLSLPEDWDHFAPHLQGFLRRVPAAEKAEVQQLFNGPESFSPDCNPLFGPAPEMDNYFVMAGLSSQGVVLSGGLGRVMAEWIVNGHAPLNTWCVDLRRFTEYHNNKAFLRDRVTESEGIHYHNPFPGDVNFETGRMLRCSPLFGAQKQAGAVFAEKVGVERPVYYMNPANQEEFYDELQKGTFGKPAWFDYVNEEYWACRESVCLMDMSSFSKFELESDGPEACALLQKLCPNEMNMPIGSVAHTPMLNERGGYENDCSVARVSENKYFMISPTQQLRRGFKWISKHLPSDGSVQLRDVTSYYTGINVLGPRARSVLQRLTTTSVTLVDMKPFTVRDISIGYANSVRALSVTHAGEDGCVLYIPNEMAINVYNSLMSAGKSYGIRNVGYYALRWLRIEKLFAYWADDFNDTHTPYEIGREHRVKFDKDIDFIGKSALLDHKNRGIRCRLTQFTLEDHDIDYHLWPAGGEPIYRNGQYTGLVTSTGYGPSLGKIVCLGWVTNSDPMTHDYVTKANYEVDIAGQRYKAKASLYPHKQATRHALIG
ncbi:pyruvate dehydrogenase phosphatase regulatory subunit, mitochondrial-like [Lytechinus variegatus]|uniref:pyruvate dehydrogenase phosphatase regulatory subunit, mitochondrial-like n=1 Tax=Lytechinus variegatus TaxID=7654 RepID=UPI001BB24DF7|nr:pyruvate dehydrogenase phosphatase regulatory subunit, mitochondrial-like [Lytechinus variegatus]XP_041454473.1 pyruvate dehydrogenase phosphatase regulatory subunit, mitochondrial-like [Lytechinus variegatus]